MMKIAFIIYNLQQFSYFQPALSQLGLISYQYVQLKSRWEPKIWLTCFLRLFHKSRDVAYIFEGFLPTVYTLICIYIIIPIIIIYAYVYTPYILSLLPWWLVGSHLVASHHFSLIHLAPQQTNLAQGCNKALVQAFVGDGLLLAW